MEDVERAQRLIGHSMRDVGKDPETGQFDADVIQTGTSKSQRESAKTVKEIIQEMEHEYEGGVPYDAIIDRLIDAGIDKSKAEHEFEKLRRQGDVYEPHSERFRIV